jgi:hypothetical protein
MGRSERRAGVRAGLRSWLRRVPPWGWMLVCLAVAAVYVVVWPRDLAPADTANLRYLVLRWFHPLAWLLLAASCALRMSSLPGKTRLANAVALLAIPAYAAFFFAIATG